MSRKYLSGRGVFAFGSERHDVHCAASVSDQLVGQTHVEDHSGLTLCGSADDDHVCLVLIREVGDAATQVAVVTNDTE
jgi:hypothetical protein